MNRLYLSTTYLVGAMDRVPDGGVQWREHITPWLNSRGIIVLNPCDKPCNIGKENSETRAKRHEAKSRGDYSLLLADKDVRAVDLRMTDKCDFLIVNIDMESHPCGTYEEITTANRAKRPIIIRCEQGKNQLPDWLFWMIPHEFFFDTWTQVYNYLDHVNSAPDAELDSKKRWIFFDLGKATQDAIDGFAKRNALLTEAGK